MLSLLTHTYFKLIVFIVAHARARHCYILGYDIGI